VTSSRLASTAVSAADSLAAAAVAISPRRVTCSSVKLENQQACRKVEPKRTSFKDVGGGRSSTTPWAGGAEEVGVGSGVPSQATISRRKESPDIHTLRKSV
jgi:hypothetical protein